jgi:serine/threonine protein kinase
MSVATKPGGAPSRPLIPAAGRARPERPRDPVKEIMDRWRAGEAPDALAARAAHPELTSEQFGDLIYDEFRLRLERGGDFDPEAFAERYPCFRSELFELLGTVAFANRHLLGSSVRLPGVGETVLGFHLRRELGAGGFARVYLAEEADLGNRLVVVKLSPGGAGEARTLGRLDHPNIVPVHSFRCDPDTGLTAVCMPYLGGATLQDLLDTTEGGLPARASIILDVIERHTLAEVPRTRSGPPARVLRRGSYLDGVLWLAAQAANGLAFLHERGILHRDLKPANVLLGPAGRPLLLDFNLAAPTGAGGPGVGGTVPYMAPEQLRASRGDSGVAVDARADLYSFGVILYQLVTGALPYEPPPDGADRAEVCRQMLLRQDAGFRPVCQRNPRVEPWFARLIERCLAADPAARPRGAAEVAAELRRGLSWPGQVRRWAGRRPWTAAALAAVVLAGALAGSAAAWQRPPYAERQLSRGLAEYRQRNYAQALDAFNTALTAKPDLAGGHFARARAYQRAREWAQAIADYGKVREPALQGAAHACIAHCLIRDRHHLAAEPYHERALAEGVAPAVIYNNRAYVYLYLKRFEEARENLDRALAIAPDMQAAWHNRALWVRDVTLKPIRRDAGGPIPKEIPEKVRAILAEQREAAKRALEAARPALAKGLQAAERALELGPASGELHADVARLMALARREPDWAEQALTHLEAAVEQGYHPGLWQGNGDLSDLRKHPRWLALVGQPSTGPQPSTPRLVDPVAD